MGWRSVLAGLALPPLVATGCVGQSPPPTVAPAPELVIVTPAPTVPATPIPGIARRYTVVEGDTLSGIAAMFGVREDAIVSANGLRDRDQVYAGQELVIPAAGS